MARDAAPSRRVADHEVKGKYEVRLRLWSGCMLSESAGNAEP